MQNNVVRTAGIRNDVAAGQDKGPAAMAKVFIPHNVLGVVACTPNDGDPGVSRQFIVKSEKWWIGGMIVQDGDIAITSPQ